MVKSVKSLFAYGTLKEGQRNHKYFKDSIIKIEKGYIYASLYDLIDHSCPTIAQGHDKIYGELITFEDEDDEIENAIDYLESNFGKENNLPYEKINIDVHLDDDVKKSKVYILQSIKDLNVKKINNEW